MVRRRLLQVMAFVSGALVLVLPGVFVVLAVVAVLLSVQGDAGAVGVWLLAVIALLVGAIALAVAGLSVRALKLGGGADRG